MSKPTPEAVRGAIAWAKKHATKSINSEKHLLTLASHIESLESPGEGWRTMESAPRDGTRFLLALDVCGTGEKAVWDTVANEGYPQGFEGVEPDDILLGWMPSPKAPDAPVSAPNGKVVAP